MTLSKKQLLNLEKLFIANLGISDEACDIIILFCSNSPNHCLQILWCENNKKITKNGINKLGKMLIHLNLSKHMEIHVTGCNFEESDIIHAGEGYIYL